MNKIDDLGERAAAERAWAGSPDIRKEFGTKERFVAWRLAHARGQARVLGGPAAPARTAPAAGASAPGGSAAPVAGVEGLIRHIAMHPGAAKPAAAALSNRAGASPLRVASPGPHPTPSAAGTPAARPAISVCELNAADSRRAREELAQRVPVPALDQPRR